MTVFFKTKVKLERKKLAYHNGCVQAFIFQLHGFLFRDGEVEASKSDIAVAGLFGMLLGQNCVFEIGQCAVT